MEKEVVARLSYDEAIKAVEDSIADTLMYRVGIFNDYIQSTKEMICAYIKISSYGAIVEYAPHNHTLYVTCPIVSDYGGTESNGY